MNTTQLLFLPLLALSLFSCGQVASVIRSASELAPADKLKISTDVPLLEMDEGSSAQLVILLGRPSPADLSVNWQIAGGDTEFHVSAGELRIPKGSSSVILQIRHRQDSLYTGDRSFALTVEGSANVFLEPLILPIRVLEDELPLPPLTVTIQQAFGQPDPAFELPLSFDLVFSRPIDPLSFTAADLIQGGTSTGVLWNVTDSGDQTRFLVSAVSVGSSGTVSPRLPAAQVQGAEGGTNEESGGSDFTVTYDSTRPTVILSTASASPTRSTPITVRVEFSEVVSGLNEADFTAFNSSVSALASLDDGRTYSLSLTPAADGTLSVELPAARAQDLYGHGNLASNVLQLVFDRTPPAVPTSLSFSPASPASERNPLARGTADADVATLEFFSDSQCSLLIGSGSGEAFAGAGVSLQMTENATTSVFARSADAAGNLSACVNVGSYRHDNLAPTISSFDITSSSPTSDRTVSFTSSLAGSPTQYCLLENNSSVAACTWSPLPMPGSYTVSAASGEKRLSLWARDEAGNVSARFESQAVVLEDPAPSAPTSLSRQNPTSQYGTDSTPLIRVHGVASGQTVTLFTTSTCDVGTSKGSAAATGTTVDIESELLTEGLHRFYARTTSAGGASSPCSTAFINYTFDTTAPTAPTNLSLGPVPSSTASSPALTWTAATDTGGSGIQNSRAELYSAADNSLVATNSFFSSGNSFTGLNLTVGAQYYIRVWSVDRAGNEGPKAQSLAWTVQDRCQIIGGITWCKSISSSESCDAICAGRDGVHPATTYHVGSHGTDANCQSITTTLSMGGGWSGSGYGSLNVGCMHGNTSWKGRGFLNTTYNTGANSGSGSRRACACNRDSTPAPAPADSLNASVTYSNSTMIGLKWTRGGDGVLGFRIAYTQGSTTPPADCSSAQMMESNFASGFNADGDAFAGMTGLQPNTDYGIRICSVGSGGSLSTGVTLTTRTQVLDLAAQARAPQFINRSASSVVSGSSMTYNHEVSGSDRFLVVAITGWLSLPTVNSVTYNGQSLQRLGRQESGGWVPLELWTLVNPPVGIHAIQIQFASAPSYYAGSSAATLNGVHQTAPMATLYEGTRATGGGTVQSTRTGSAQDELVLGFGSFYYAGMDMSPSYTFHYVNDNWVEHRIWTAPGDNPVHLQWTEGSNWSVYLLTLKPSALP